ncbi:MAG: hypothetical protein K0R67_2464, partial [Paenibacillus sp.]|nr:hypothetical protein [Paenibacillus sp.]
MDFYDTLGIKKIINGWGTVTMIGGSLMDPEVVSAMNEAARSYVDIRTLHKKAGEHIAELLGCEAASITSGASAGIAISAAACMTKGDAARVLQLPDTTGMPGEVLMLKSHRILYDQALALSGAKITEIGVTSAANLRQLESAVSDSTAMFFYVAEAERMRGSIPLPEIVQVLRKYNIPVVVDAAAELPPTTNLTKYLNQGADLVLFSGGKELRGPQSSGLIIGKKELVQYCDANNYPNYSIGRSMKLDKETIAGLVKAVELFVKKDYDLQMEAWEAMVAEMILAWSAIPEVVVRRGFPTEPGVQPVIIPRVYMTSASMSARELQ